MSNINQNEELDNQLKKIEIEKIKNDIKSSKSKLKREWLVTISIIASIIATAFSAYKTLSDLSFSYKEQAFKHRLETTKLFLNEVLPAIKNQNISSSNQAEKKGAYILAISLSKEFPILSEPIYSVIKSNSENGDTDALQVLSAKN